MIPPQTPARVLVDTAGMRPLLVLCLVLAACEGPAGPAGTNGDNGSDGAAGPKGQPGIPGDLPPPAPWIVGAGVDVTITGLAFDATGATVSFTLADAHGEALDRTGHLTAGDVEVGFVLAQLGENTDGSPGQYTAFTTTASLPATESVDASFTAVDVTLGTYRYKVAAPLTGLDATKTQTVAAYAKRTFDGASVTDRDQLSVRPDGGAVATREQVTDQTCNGCHGSLRMHGGTWTSSKQCVMCHQPQAGAALDFK